MPNCPVRDQWEYMKKMEQHFPIKLGQPIEMALVISNSSSESLIMAKNWFVKNGTANFGRNFPTKICGPPPEVIPNIPVERNQNRPFHLNSNQNFRNLWHNGKHLWYPRTADAKANVCMFWHPSLNDCVVTKQTFWIVLLRLFSFKSHCFLSTVGFSNEDNCCQLQGIGKLIKEKLSKGIFKVA